MSLDATVRIHLGRLDLDVALTAADGETVAVLGPNGAGKTTLLRALAGLVPIEGGRIELDGAVLDDPGTDTFVTPEHRPVGVVFQDYLLFPHLSAQENVAFGLRARGVPRAEARRRATGWLERMDLAAAARARPAQLSGGQAQRVALARALVTEPRLLLLDEPLAALDAGTRSSLRRALRRDLAAFAGVRVLVTHDPLDAAALADRLVVVEDGRVVQTGTLAEVTARPRSAYVAELVGVNLLRGRAAHGHVELDGGGVLTAVSDLEGAVLAVVHPHAVALHAVEPQGSPRNHWPGRVGGVELLGDRVRVRVEGAVPLVAEVTPAAVRELGLEEGREVWTSVKATEVGVYAE